MKGVSCLEGTILVAVLVNSAVEKKKKSEDSKASSRCLNTFEPGLFFSDFAVKTESDCSRGTDHCRFMSFGGIVMLFSKYRLRYSELLSSETVRQYMLFCCVGSTCSHFSANTWPFLPTTLHNGIYARMLGFSRALPPQKGAAYQSSQQALSKPDQPWTGHPTSPAAYLHRGNSAMCPQAQLSLPPMHVEQAGYFVAQYKMSASFFYHVIRRLPGFAELAFAVLHAWQIPNLYKHVCICFQWAVKRRGITWKWS